MLHLGVLAGLGLVPAVAQATPRPSRGPTSVEARRELVRLPVTLHFAVRDGDVVARLDEAHRWIADADRALAPHGIVLDVRRIERLPEGMVTGESWRARRALGRRAPRDGTIHVFVLDSLDRASRRGVETRGIYWRYLGLQRELRGREYIAVSAHAPSSTLAHEIGHALGLGHARSRENVMCSCDRERRPDFSPDQGQQLRTAAARRFSIRRVAQGR